MKKVVLSFMIFSAVLSCKKDEKADSLPEHTEEVVSHQAILEPMTTASFAKEEHDFGDLKKGDVVQYAYEVTNTGDKPLVISRVQPACGCTAPNYTQEPIAPGEKGQITAICSDGFNFCGVLFLNDKTTNE